MTRIVPFFQGIQFYILIRRFDNFSFAFKLGTTKTDHSVGGNSGFTSTNTAFHSPQPCQLPHDQSNSSAEGCYIHVYADTHTRISPFLPSSFILLRAHEWNFTYHFVSYFKCFPSKYQRIIIRYIDRLETTTPDNCIQKRHREYFFSVFTERNFMSFYVIHSSND